MKRVDVLVVGAGPAGAVAAREVARGGASVLLVDRSPFPRGKVCGACLSRGAGEVLEAVGLGGLSSGLGGEPLHSFVVAAGRRSVRLRLPGGRAVSREVFDAALVRAAREEGVDFMDGARAQLGPVGRDHRVVRVERGGGGVEVAARVVLDASGLGGNLAEAGHRDGEGTDFRAAVGSRIGLGAAFDDPAYPVSLGYLHMAVGRTGYVGLVRVESGVLNLAAAVDPAALRSAGGSPRRVVERILSSASLPPLAGRPLAEWRGTPPLTRSPEDVAGDRLLRLGDAGGYVEPFTGEGMCWAMSGAVAAAALAVGAADHWRPELAAAWRRHHRTVLRRARRLCRVLTPALRRPWLVDGALAALTVAPVLAGPFVRRATRMPGLSVAGTT